MADGLGAGLGLRRVLTARPARRARAADGGTRRRDYLDLRLFAVDATAADARGLQPEQRSLASRPYQRCRRLERSPTRRTLVGTGVLVLVAVGGIGVLVTGAGVLVGTGAPLFRPL